MLLAVFEDSVKENEGTTSYPAAVPYARRVSVTGGIVVGCSGSASAQPSFANSVQNAQNNFSAAMARQQQQMLKQQVRTFVIT
ncbi:unnamed protein product [Gongylonema pulchrum]|uniref:Curli production assembly/transport component CsgF n=1 Tax=Gongylonema pulchrum TaxID=637853 RepID=A0A183D8P9_9BILA|nr:unnamed protein product [Gongylonema pulchrum]